jgi:hypothetical protein
MIHIATVHFQSDRWIPIQLAYLRKHIQSPFRVYAWLNEVPPVPPDTFYYCCSEPVKPHAIKLNLLADLIYFDSNRDDDIIIFLDGDAFPIGDLEPFLREKLKTHKLVAIQRLENNGDIQPHPCFCATTVGFWHSIKGDWNEGHLWTNNGGVPTTDVGGNLLKILSDRGTDWYRILRSNGLTNHPVLFGIYGGLIYHHGAGFRNPVTRGDMANFQISWLDHVRAVFPSRVERVTLRRVRKKMAAANHVISEEFFQQIAKDPDFFGKYAAVQPKFANAAPLQQAS